MKDTGIQRKSKRISDVRVRPLVSLFTRQKRKLIDTHTTRVQQQQQKDIALTRGQKWKKKK